MPRRHLILLVVVALVSWACYLRAVRNRYATTLAEAMHLIQTHYVQEVEPRVLFEGAMRGMVGTLDSYSHYSPPDEFDHFQRQMEGTLVGVGIVVQWDDAAGQLKVVEALIGKPAYQAGIRAGDAIVRIDGVPVDATQRLSAVTRIRGQPGTTVRLGVIHPGETEETEYTLQRTTIPLATVLGDIRREDGTWVYRLVDHPRIGYIRIFDQFSERTAEEFRAALASFRREGEEIDGLILDLRYNPGGLLEAATEICDMLLERGLIVTTCGRGGVELERYEARPGVELPEHLPLVVLVDRLSASASEILAAALQDNGRAVVVGQRTWGKGTVQNVLKLEGGRSALRLTVGTYRRPSGKEIHKWKHARDEDDWGVRPDPGCEVLLTNRQYEQIVEARRRRDQLTWAELRPPSAAAATPLPAPVSSSQPGDTSTDAELDLEEAARCDPTQIDPQLARAVAWIKEQLSSSHEARGTSSGPSSPSAAPSGTDSGQSTAPESKATAAPQ
jgi:carboxyl-terminal processing protease